MQESVKFLIESKEALNVLSKTQNHIENTIFNAPNRSDSEARTPSQLINKEINHPGGFFPLEDCKISLIFPNEKSFGNTDFFECSEEMKGSPIIYVKSPQTIKSRGLSHQGSHGPLFGIEAEEISMEMFEKRGYLLVKSSGLFQKWQKQYFVVTCSKLYWAHSEEAYEAKVDIKCVNLLVNHCNVLETQNQDFSIELEGLSLVFKFRAASINEAQEWIECLKENNNCEDENFEKGRYITCTDHLFKADVQTEEKFLANVETGDILLFRANHLGAKLQRFFTYSDYDHVALVLKSQNDIFIFDAVYEDGVQLTSWSDFKKNGYYTDYPMIAYRKLMLENKKQIEIIHEKLWTFASKHVGKKYELGFGKIFRKSAFIHVHESGSKHQACYMDHKEGSKTQREGKNEESSKKPRKGSTETLTEQNTEDGFFCSELVAEAYKFSGLLDESISSVRYLPVSFSQRKKLTLLNGASLSHENGLALINEQTKR